MKQRSEVEALATHELALVRGLARDWLAMDEELASIQDNIKAHADAMISKHKRDAFSMAALPLVRVSRNVCDADLLTEQARLAFDLADAMLAESTKRALADLPVKP